jgi:hypothetical protein
VVSVTSADSGATSVNVTVLGYGCIYQGGYLFAVDDTTPGTGSISGKVAAISDQAPAYPNGLVWASNGTPGQSDYSDIPGIYDDSTTPCVGDTDGACNTAQIAAFYSPASSFPPSLYAAGLCLETISGYSDWYLPAICEMGFIVGSYPYSTGCGSSTNPTVQNMESNLVGTGVLPLSGYYWSSTEGSDDPAAHAWLESFSTSGGSSMQVEAAKFVAAGAHCARALTP